MRLFIAALLTAALPTQSFALSCMMWDAADVYNRAAESETRYLIVHGAFLRNGPDLIEPDTLVLDGAQTPYSYQAVFFGNIASRVGFRTPTELEVTVNVPCVASWCGFEPPEGQEVLAFLEVDDDRNYRLVSGPCPFALNSAPTEADLNQITACMAGEDCAPFH